MSTRKFKNLYVNNTFETTLGSWIKLVATSNLWVDTMYS